MKASAPLGVKRTSEREKPTASGKQNLVSSMRAEPSPAPIAWQTRQADVRLWTHASMAVLSSGPLACPRGVRRGVRIQGSRVDLGAARAAAGEIRLADQAGNPPRGQPKGLPRRRRQELRPIRQQEGD